MTLAPRLAATVLAVLIVGCGAPTEATAPPSGLPSSTGSAPPGSSSLPRPGETSGSPAPTGEPSGPTSTDLILAALDAGDLSAEDAAVYRVFAAFGDARLPAEFQSDAAGWEDHLATRDAAGLWDSLSAEQRDAIAPYFIPPIYAGSWADPASQAGLSLTAGFGLVGAPVTAAVDPKNCASEQLRDQFYVNVPAASGKVRIWWRNGVDTSARAGTIASMVAQEMDTNIWPKLTALMGREPLSDAAVGCFNGEDGALDIYITDRTLPGYAEALTLAYPGACTGTPAFIIFDQPRAGDDYGTMNPDKLHAWKYAHEVFHALQYAYTYDGPCAAFAEMDEATAMWAAEHVYPDEQFEWNRGWGSWFLWNHDALFGNESAGGGYGSWPLFASLTQRHGVERMPQLYGTAEQVSGPYDAIELTIPAGIDGYWPQFVRDLWDDHPEHNVWLEWDPVAWTERTVNAGATERVELPRAGGGGLITHTLFSPRPRWRIAKWDDASCVRPESPGWSDFDSTVGQWTCPLKANEEPLPVASYDVEARVRPLGRNEHELWFADEDWPRYIKIDQPGLALEDDHLSVQGFYQRADSSWSGPHDWKGEDQIEFCRDNDDEDVGRVVILYGNSEVETPGSDPIRGTYNVEVREACPATYDVTITLTGVDSGYTTEQWTITGTVESHDPTKTYPVDQPIDKFVGTATYTGAGLYGFLNCETGPSMRSGSGSAWLTGYRQEEWVDHEGTVLPGPFLVISAFRTEFVVEETAPPWGELLVWPAPLDGQAREVRIERATGGNCRGALELTVRISAAVQTEP